MVDMKRGIFFRDAVDRSRELHIVLALLGTQRHRVNRLRDIEADQRRNAAFDRTQRTAGSGFVKLAEACSVACFCRGELCLVLSEHARDARYLRGAAARDEELHAVRDRARQNTGDRELAAVWRMKGLHHLDDGVLAVRQTETLA